MTVATEPRITYRDLRTRAEELADERYKEEILAGIDLLQEKYGESWVDHIDPLILSMGSTQSCILGQLYGTYRTGRIKLGIEHTNGSRFGFDTDRDSYFALNMAWKKILA